MTSLIHERSGDLVEQREAVFDPDRVYRYLLTRVWDPDRAPMVIIGLNPSTADGFADDHTITRCRAFARREGCGGLAMVNLFAYRSTDPDALKYVCDAVGPDNDTFLREAAAAGAPVVAAWGVHGALGGRDQTVFELLSSVLTTVGRPLTCLGLTATGSPATRSTCARPLPSCPIRTRPPRPLGPAREEADMADYQFPKAPELDTAYRTVQQALLGIIPPELTLGDGEEGLPIGDLISHVRHLLDMAEMTVAAQLGPRISWHAPAITGAWDLIPTGVDLDEHAEGFGGIELEQSASEGPDGKWYGSPLDRAAYAYKREAGWDFTPGQAGIWLLMLAPTSAGGGETWTYSGHLVGFVILHDRDEDGVYECVAHIWTAKAWRRRGIARRLLAEAKSRFGFTDVEGPYTKDGAALLCAVGQLEPEDADDE